MRSPEQWYDDARASLEDDLAWGYITPEQYKWLLRELNEDAKEAGLDGPYL